MNDPGLRERTRRAVRTEIAAVAMRLFLDRGFDRVTIDQVAAEAGVSRRSLFRYFDTKEDLVLGNLADSAEAVLAALEARPAGEDAWTALRAAFQVLVENPAFSADRTTRTWRMLRETPSLRARYLEKHLRMVDLLVPQVARRLGVAPGGPPDPRPTAIVTSALACLDTAVEVWAASDGEQRLEDLYDQAVAAVRS
ncbi:TetR family transcriptional regulator [Saccharothrix lopnurensis]|uniref:TetR family transcriptional regulator n=1 Tax=Saccharothrix lopnurensis TaxID=1670621 RepID=A0ABW1P5A5_9PSEU